MDRYLAKLDHTLRALQGECETIYVGGGTPTLFDLERLKRFTKLVFERLCPGSSTEISIEANPETLDAEKVAFLREHYTRLSLGVQSFDSGSRERIGRNCSQAKLESAIALIREAQFPHWNCDLIYSLPGQNRKMWENDLHLAAQTGADHISCYALTPEENARLGAEFEEDDERETEFYFAAQQVLSQYGIERYEISNYAKIGGVCRHNQSVWRGGLLRGFGPSAAGFDGVKRMIEPESLALWLDDAPAELDEIPLAARLNEIFAVNLRTAAGWTPELWAQVPGADSWEERRQIAGNLQKIFPDYLLNEQKRIKLTENGLLFWNTIAQELF